MRAREREGGWNAPLSIAEGGEKFYYSKKLQYADRTGAGDGDGDGADGKGGEGEGGVGE